MSSSDDANSSSNVFALFASALGMVTVIPMIWSIIESQLPPAKFKKLEQALVDTETLLQSIIEEGLQFREIPHYESYLINFRSSAERIREETYRATTFWEHVYAWFDGLSSRIGVLCKQIQEVRASICESSAEARAQLSAGDEVVTPVSRGLLARLGCILRRIFAFLLPKIAITEVVEPAATSGEVSSRPRLAAPACAQVVPPDDALVTASSTPDRSIENAEPHACAAPTAGTVPAKKRRRRILQAISRLEQEMSARRVRNAALRKIVQAAHRQRSTVTTAQSSKSRRTRKSRALLVPCGTAAHVVLSQACDSDEDEPDVDSWENELVVSVKTHAIF